MPSQSGVRLPRRGEPGDVEVADSFRFVPRLAKSERELIVDGPDAGVVVRQLTSKR